MLENMIGRIPAIVAGSQFQDEMRRFTPSDVYDRTLGQEKFQQFLVSNVTKILKELQSRMAGETPPEFVM